MIFKSRFKDVSVPNVNLAAFVFQRMENYPSRVAFRDGISGRTLSYSEVVQKSKTLAAGLTRLGMKKGDALAIYAPNMPEYALAFYGSLLLGGTVTPLSAMWKTDELHQCLKASGSRLVFTIAPFLQNILQAKPGTRLEHVILLDQKADHTHYLNDLTASAEDFRACPVQAQTDVALMPYSSGTWGKFKPVQLTHYNLLANALPVLETPEFKPLGIEDVLGLLPFSHIYGTSVFLIWAPLFGGTVTTLASFDFQRMLELIEIHRIRRFNVVPPLVHALSQIKDANSRDLSSLQILPSGGANLPEAIAKLCQERVGCLVTSSYGMTELGPMISATPERPDMVRHGSVGLLFPNTEAKVIDTQTGMELGPHQVGELWVKSPRVMLGYAHDSEANASAFSEGYFRTGDLCEFDTDGYLFVRGRSKELIKYKGHQVAPTELEDILLDHPQVVQAAVVPRPHKTDGEWPVAYVVASGAVSEQDLFKWMKEKVASYKMIRAVVFVEDIPKSPTGKVLRLPLIELEKGKAAYR